MRSFRLTPAAIAVALAVMATPAWTEAPADAAEAAVDPAAVAALERMVAYLRTLKTFQVEVATTTEDVLDDGQKLQYAGISNILAQLPNKLRADVANDDFEHLYLYDGQHFTLWARRLNYYATVPAPPTIRELADRVEEKFGIEVPLVDLFRWTSPGWTAAGIKAARDVGPSQVAGTTCQHYAFREDGLDWQIWLQKGDYPLPRKLVLTTLTDETRPQFSALYTWNLAPSVNDLAFTFLPPVDAHKVALAEVPPAGK